LARLGIGPWPFTAMWPFLGCAISQISASHPSENGRLCVDPRRTKLNPAPIANPSAHNFRFPLSLLLRRTESKLAIAIRPTSDPARRGETRSTSSLGGRATVERPHDGVSSRTNTNEVASAVFFEVSYTVHSPTSGGLVRSRSRPRAGKWWSRFYPHDA
jgi:hypothetical protein